MNETRINVPRGTFDDEGAEMTGTPAPKKEIFVTGKELGIINVEGLGQYVFSILGDSNKEGGLDLIMTDADGEPSKVITISKNIAQEYKINSQNLATIQQIMPGHETKLSRIVEDYIEELKDFGVTV